MDFKTLKYFLNGYPRSNGVGKRWTFVFIAGSYYLLLSVPDSNSWYSKVTDILIVIYKRVKCGIILSLPVSIC